MSTVRKDVPPALALARRLVERSSGGKATRVVKADDVAAALERLYLDLSRWVGLDGCHALFTRALADAREKQQSLEEITLHARSTPYLQGVTAAVEKEGSAKTAAALEAMLVVLIELLGRLIGIDMAANLIERGLGGSTTSQTAMAEGARHEE
ncbi:MAG TPA: hypothetical protein VNC11_06040 [Gemmatimonadaceae bacterium]|nr:hypothetical protein [Gemmatimonadaceae bacterium]